MSGDVIDQSGEGKSGWRAAAALGAAGFFAVAVRWHLFCVNSAYFYELPWQWKSTAWVWGLMLPWAAVFFAGLVVQQRRPDWVWIALGLVMVGTLGMMISAAAAQTDPPSLSRISSEELSRWTTGYFDSAARVVQHRVGVRRLLGEYPHWLKYFFLHARQKPPGVVVMEMQVIRLFGDGAAGAAVCGWATAALATLGVAATYGFIWFFTGDRNAAFLGASYWGLCPSLLLFFPDLDACFPILTVGITVLWGLALRRRSIAWALAAGLVSGAAVFVTYLPGLLVIFLAGLTVLSCVRKPRLAWPRALLLAAAGIGAAAAFYAALWAATGFDPLATLEECHRQWVFVMETLYRVYHRRRPELPWTFFTDLYEFAMGAGWIGLVLAGFYVGSIVKRGMTQRASALSCGAWVALLCVGQFVVMAMSGRVATETSRTWMFAYPMLMLPIGLELARWRPGARLAVFAALLVLTVLMCQSMEFMSAAM